MDLTMAEEGKESVNVGEDTEDQEGVNWREDTEDEEGVNWRKDTEDQEGVNRREDTQDEEDSVLTEDDESIHIDSGPQLQNDSLVALVEDLKEKLIEERKKNLKIEGELREELCQEFNAMIVEVEDDWEQRLEEERYNAKDLAEWRIAEYSEAVRKEKKEKSCQDEQEKYIIEKNIKEKDEKIKKQVILIQEIINELQVKIYVLEESLETSKGSTHEVGEHVKIKEFEKEVDNLRKSILEERGRTVAAEAVVEDLRDALDVASSNDYKNVKRLNDELDTEIRKGAEQDNLIRELEVQLEKVKEELENEKIKVSEITQQMKVKNLEFQELVKNLECETEKATEAIKVAEEAKADIMKASNIADLQKIAAKEAEINAKNEESFAAKALKQGLSIQNENKMLRHENSELREEIVNLTKGSNRPEFRDDNECEDLDVA